MNVRYERRIAAPTEAAWPLLAHLGRLAEWLPTVERSPSDPLAVGAVRRAVLKKPAYGKDTLVERVTRVEARGFTYEIDGGIGPMRRIVTTWRVEPDGGATRLLVESELEVSGIYRFMGPLVRAAWRKQLAAMADAFAAFVRREALAPSPTG